MAVDPTGLIFSDPKVSSGLHVLLIGVSSYPYLDGGLSQQQQTFGLGQLDCAARTASEIAVWLLANQPQLAKPIQTLRLLASATDVERALQPELAQVLPATFENVLTAAWAWRADTARARDGASMFYFAGHGIQRTRGDSVLLLEDFLVPNRPLLDRAIDFGGVYDGMGESSFADMAQTQLYFVDACRTDLRGVQALAAPVAQPVFDVTEGGADNRVAPIFYAASTGRAAYGSAVAGGRSAFGGDFLHCIGGGAADLIRGDDGTSRWTVTLGGLSLSLSQLVRTANEDTAPLRSFMIDKWTDIDTPVAYLADAPEVDCHFLIEPSEAGQDLVIALNRGQKILYSFGPPCGPPNPGRARAGGYLLNARSPRFGLSEDEIITVKPPVFRMALRMEAL